MLGNAEAAGELAGVLEDVKAAIDGYDSGQRTFEEMEAAIGDTLDEARAMIAVMNDVDRQRFPAATPRCKPYLVTPKSCRSSRRA